MTADELIDAITRTREEQAAHRLALHRASNVSDRLQRSFHDHAGLFFGSAAAVGLLLALIPSSRKSRRESRASQRVHASHQPAQTKQSRSLLAVIAGLAGKVALDVGKPVLMKMIRDHYTTASRQAAGPAHEPHTPVP